MEILKNKIFLEDIEYINTHFEERNKLKGSKILITGCAGFLGYYFLHYFTIYFEELGLEKIIGLDNFILNKPSWLEKLSKKNETLEIKTFDISKDNLDLINLEEVDYILHMASIASPTFYRKYPIQTLDANIWGLRKILDFYKNKSIKGLLMFSSSEVYGDPDNKNIPTSEKYFGNVSTIGPRACYDESKRFSETLCYLYARKFAMPISMVRPFNNYGPGMSLRDKRVPADFALAISKNHDITIFSDGSPTRTFCYVTDAIVGYLKALTYGKFDIFNIGIDKPEISIYELAKIYKCKGKSIFNYSKEIRLEKSKELDYMKNNPNRRCPNIEHSRKELNFNPNILIEEGIERFLSYTKYEEQIW